jgi:streptogramin lyase
VVSNPSCCSRADGIATDAQGNAWVASYQNSSVSEISPLCDATGVSANAACTTANSVVTLSGVTGGGLSYPGQLSVDAGQNVWVVNIYSPPALQHGSFSEVAGNAASVAAGTALSPSNGYGLDVSLVQPYAIVPDASGNLWVSNQGENNLLMFLGLATPTATPARPFPVAP